MAQLSTGGLLKEIQSEDLERVYIGITEKAIEWAVAGFMEEANKLLEDLWARGLPHSGNLWVPDEGLQVMWQLSGMMPSAIPFTFKSIEDIERNNATGLSQFLAAGGAPASAARNKDTQELEKFVKRFAVRYFQGRSNWGLYHLMRERTTAKLLLDGALRPFTALTKEICREEGVKISAALSQRLSEGRALVYGDLPWQQLLKKISLIAIEQEEFDFTPEAKELKSLARPPAAASDIEDAEKRLGVTLPQDYKDFLGVSNGFDASSSTGVTISPVDRIDFLRNFDAELVEIWTDGKDNDVFNKKFTNSIIIGGHEDEQQLLLVPLENNDWECWFFATWIPGEWVYPGFRFYIEELLQKLEEEFSAG